MSKVFYFIAVTVFLLSSGLTHATETPWATTDYARMRMVAGAEAFGETAKLEAALHMEMYDGWHSYWRVPGDAGAPPRFDWSGSKNVVDVETIDVSWQAPTRFEESGFQTFGYSDDVYFPFIVNVEDPGKAVTLKVNIRTMVCKDICIPQVFELAMEIPPNPAAGFSGQQRVIDVGRRLVPVQGNTAALKIETIVAGPDALVLNAYSKNGFEAVDVFAYAPEFALTGVPEITVDKADTRRAMITIPKPEDIKNLSAALEGQDLSITLVSGDDAIERKITF